MKILLVTANASSEHLLHQILTEHQFVVDIAKDGIEAWELLQNFIYDLLLVDAYLPKLNGLTLCRHLREVGNPILILLMIPSLANQNNIQGLESGADACITQPIEGATLLAHLCALTRRGSNSFSSNLSWGPLTLNLLAQRITCQGQTLKLNRKEYQLLALFIRFPQRMFSFVEIGDRLWTIDEQIPTNATIKSHIRSIRRKLEKVGIENFIQTHYSQGYCVNPIYSSNSQVTNPLSLISDQRLDTITANIWQELMTANARLHQEIEQRKEIELQLRRSERMLRQAQRVAQIGCWEFHPETEKIYWTEELFLIHGLDPQSPVPTTEEILLLIHPDDLPLHEKAILEPVLRQEPFEANLRIIRVNDGGIRYINARGGPIFDSTGHLVKLTGTTFDLTQWLAIT